MNSSELTISGLVKENGFTFNGIAQVTALFLPKQKKF